MKAGQDLVLSGGFGTSTNSARSGYLPIRLEAAPIPSLSGIAVFVRRVMGSDKKESFVLYCGETTKFTQQHRLQLVKNDVKYIYISMDKQEQFRRQTEEALLQIAEDPSMAIAMKSEIIYETSVELMNELLSEPNLGAKSAKLEMVSRAVTTLILNDPTAFSHLFAASHHDFYTATHMVNVATWMVPLAYAMGHTDTAELSQICIAGMLHDIGKLHVSSEILNKKSKLSNAEWDEIRKHPEYGVEHLKQYDNIPELVKTVTLEHHERMDGSGYPRKLTGAQMNPVSRICAVVDSFDAMTAFRPFKTQTLSVEAAIKILMTETPLKYDPEVMKEWCRLLDVEAEVPGAGAKDSAAHSGRTQERFKINCPARLHILDQAGSEWKERLGQQVVAHNISQTGVGILNSKAVQIGDRARVYLLGQGSLKKETVGIVVRCRSYRDGWYEIGLKNIDLHDPGAEIPPLAQAAAAGTTAPAQPAIAKVAGKAA